MFHTFLNLMMEYGNNIIITVFDVFPLRKAISKLCRLRMRGQSLLQVLELRVFGTIKRNCYVTMREMYVNDRS